MTLLHTFQCWGCKTVATAPFRGEFGNPLRCILCRSYMKWLYSEPITTPDQQALASRGVVYNPGVSSESVPNVE
jgi:hypothetical protein